MNTISTFCGGILGTIGGCTLGTLVGSVVGTFLGIVFGVGNKINITYNNTITVPIIPMWWVSLKNYSKVMNITHTFCGGFIGAIVGFVMGTLMGCILGGITGFARATNNTKMFEDILHKKISITNSDTQNETDPINPS